jgi:hypothetical protein
MKRYFRLALVLVAMVLLPLSAYAQKAGQIVFSSQMIDPANPTNLTKSFKAGDAIYSVAYVQDNFLKLCNSPNAKKLETGFFIYEVKPPLYSYQEPQESQIAYSTVWLSGGTMQNKSLPLDIAPKPDKMTAYGNPEITYTKFGKNFEGPVGYTEALAKLESGKHTLRVRYQCNYQVVAEGEITIDGSDYSSYAQLSEAINAAAGSIQTKNAGMPKVAMTDKKLEAEMITALKNSQTFKSRMEGQILKLIITDPEWYIRRHEISGAILHRYIRAAVAIKDKSGKCTVWPNVTFQQDYIGNKFQKSRFDGVGDPYEIPCENVK